jgi:membrane associated rhomboid family serine protease
MYETIAQGAVLRRTAERQHADAWALVLASQGISSRLVPLADAWDLVVPQQVAARAAAALEAYDRENSLSTPYLRPPDLTPGPAVARSAVAAAAFGAVLIAFHVWLVATGYRSAYLLGTANAARILGGEPWRSVTALTLHADAGHALANALFGALFLGALFQRTGVGLGLAITVGAGAAATYTNVALRGPPYDGLGASTAVFAALGALGGLAARDSSTSWRSMWVPLLAAAAMAALFGTSEESDVTAHALGLVSGLGAGVLAAPWIRAARSTPAVQSLAGVAALLLIVGAWGAALLSGAG